MAVYVDRCRGFTGQEAVVDLPRTLRELEEVMEERWRIKKIQDREKEE